MTEDRGDIIEYGHRFRFIVGVHDGEWEFSGLKNVGGKFGRGGIW